MAASSASPAHAPTPSVRRAGVSVRSLLSLGVSLARRGPLSVASMGISALTAVGLCALAISFAAREDAAPVASVPVLAASAIAWGGAFLQAVVVAMNALRRDRAEGVVQLFLTRTSTLRGYLVARVGGLAVLLAAAVFGGTLLVSLVSILAATRMNSVALTLGSTASALVFALAFSVVIAPVVFATLGARPRATGYVVLLLVLVVPEWLSGELGRFLPAELTELCAIPSALSVLRSSLSPGSVDLLRSLRALVALATIAGVAMFFVRRDVLRLQSEVT